MTSFSEDLMEDIMCLTSFSSYHNDGDAEYETAKPLYQCWGRRSFLLPLEDIGLPAAALCRSSETDPTPNRRKQEKKADILPVEPMYGKGRARILKDHSMIDGSNRENVIHPKFDMDDIDPHQFDYEFDPAIQAECAEILGTAHHVDVVPSMIDDECSVETTLPNNFQLSNCELDILGAVDSKMRNYAHRVGSAGSHSQVSDDVLCKSQEIAGENCKEKHSSVCVWLAKDCDVSEAYNIVPENSSTQNNLYLSSKHLVSELPTSSCSLLSIHSNDMSQVSSTTLPNSSTLSQVSDKEPILTNIASENVTAPYSPLFRKINDIQEPLASHDCHVYKNMEDAKDIDGNDDDDDDDDVDDEDVWQKLRQIKEQKNQALVNCFNEVTSNNTKNFIPAGAECFQEALNVMHNVEDDFISSGDEEEEGEAIMWNGKSVGEIPMYISTEQPKSSRVTLGDYFANNEKLKKPSSEKNYQCGKRTAVEPELGKEYFPELSSSESTGGKKTVASRDDSLSFSMKDLAATLLTEKQNSVQFIDVSGDNCDGVHNDIPEGTLLEIEGLPVGVKSKELKDYLEDFGEISKLDFYPGTASSTKTARLYMKDPSSCEWIISCLNGEHSPIGDDSCILTVKVVT